MPNQKLEVKFEQFPKKQIPGCQSEQMLLHRHWHLEFRQMPECMQSKITVLSTLRSPHFEASVTASSRDRSLTADRWPRCFPPTTRTVWGMACTSLATLKQACYITIWSLCVAGDRDGEGVKIHWLLGPEKATSSYSTTSQHVANPVVKAFWTGCDWLLTAWVQSCGAFSKRLASILFMWHHCQDWHK